MRQASRVKNLPSTQYLGILITSLVVVLPSARMCFKSKHFLSTVFQVAMEHLLSLWQSFWQSNNEFDPYWPPTFSEKEKAPIVYEKDCNETRCVLSKEKVNSDLGILDSILDTTRFWKIQCLNKAFFEMIECTILTTIFKHDVGICLGFWCTQGRFQIAFSISV